MSGIPSLGATQNVATTQGDLNIANGAASYNVKMDLPPAVRDLKPTLSLNYNSRGSNGLMGVGWNIGGLSAITRCRKNFTVDGAIEVGKNNLRYSTADRLCLDGQKLVLADPIIAPTDANYWSPNAVYKTEIDNFSAIKTYASGVDTYFKIKTKDGRILTYGGEDLSQQSRIRKPGQSTGAIGTWALDKVEDSYGNNYTITYTRDSINGDYYPNRMNFAPNAAVVFTYHDRTGQTPWGYDMGGYYKHAKVLEKVTTYINVNSPSSPESATPVKKYDVTYKPKGTSATDRELVDAITECGYQNNGWSCAKSLSFTWQLGEFGFDESTPHDITYCPGESASVLNDVIQFIDIDGDGYTDALTKSGDLAFGTANNCFIGGRTTGPSNVKIVQPLMTPNGYVLLVKLTDSTSTPKKYSLGVIYNINKISKTSSYLEIDTDVSETGAFTVVDINNDSLDDIKYRGKTFVQNNTPSLSFTPSGSFTAPSSTSAGFMYLDLNGDGIKDPIETIVNYTASKGSVGVFLSLSTGFFEANQTQQYNIGSGPVTIMVPGGMNRVIADINGDGNKDFLYHHVNMDPSSPNYRNAEWLYRINPQDGTSGVEVNSGVIARTPVDGGVTLTNHYSYPFDYDKDGRDDLLAVIPTGTNKCMLRVLLSRDNGVGFTFQDANVVVLNFMQTDACAPLSLGSAAGLFFGDANNDGIPDVQYRDKVYYGKVKQPDLLVSVKDGFNAETKIEYSTLVDAANNGSPLYTPDVTVPSFPLAPAGRSMQVVTKVSRSDGAAGYNDRYFNYTGAKIDLQGRGFLGFANIKETDVAKGIVITTDYRQAFPYSGRVDTATVASTSGELISSTKNVYTIQSDNARFPHIDYSIQKVFQLLTTSITSPISVTKTSSTYDACGNVAGQTTETGTGVTGASITGTLSIQTVINTVDRYDTADCSDDFVSLRTQTLSKTSASDDLKTIVTQFTPNSTAYNAIKEVLVLTAYKGTAQEKTTTLHRTLWGSVDSSAEVAKDINSGTTSTRSVASSSFSNLIYPSTITNTLSTGDHVTTVGYDRRFGEQNAITLPDGQPTSRVYDALGRLTQETLADGTLREIISFYCGNITAISCPSGGAYGVATRVTNPAKLGYLGEPLTIVYYDSLQRETRRSVYSMDGNAINTDRVYYANGKLQKVSAPYLSGGSGLQVHWTTYSNYDALGRAHTVSQPDDGSQSTSFELFGSLVRATTTIFVTGSGVNDSQITQRYTNALGQVTQVVDANNTPVDYTYNSLGSLATTMVNNNSKTLISLDYDIQGNKTYISDPDAGPINFEYNGFGELRRQTWRLGDSTYNKSMVLSYDQLGRQIQRDDTPASGQGAATSYSWAWDSKKKGHLDSETSPNKTVTYNYDANARLLSQITNITGLGSRTFTYGYDEFSRVNSVIYPNDFTMIREYHAAGMAVKTYDATDAANPKVLWALGNNIDNRGNFNNYLWGNGVVTKSGFNEKSGRLASITSGRLSNTNTVSNLYGDIQALSYDYDSMGNLHSRTSQRTDTNGAALPEYEREEFTYDKLNRLKTSTTGLLFTRLNEYQYDNLGNLTSRSSKMNGTSVNEDVGVLSYVPTAANNAGVHAVTAAGVLSYQYDKYGNMTSRGSDSIAYDVFNKPIRMSGGGSTTTIDYDANHERYREVVVSTGTTVSYSIGGGLYEEVVEGNKVTQKAYIDGVILNSRVLNSGVQASNDTLYIHTDNMGSSEAISNQFGAFVSRMSFSDWGKRQKSDWKNGSPTESFPTMNGYTGHHEMDQHNLVHMGGRVYDPAIGRFLSADLLIQSPYSSQSFNRYSYVSNNPMSNMDPTGYAGENWGCMNYLSNMGTPDASQHAETWGCPGAGGDNSGAMDSYLHQHGPSNIDVTAPETFNRQNLWDEANNQYGYASSPQRMNKLFDNDDSDVVTEIVVTGCCKNGKGTSLSVDERIGAVASEFPGAGIRITGRARTVDEQARLMAQRIRVNETQFTETYTPRPHTQEMKAWVRAHPDATMSETSQAFSGIIRRALATGAAVSNHLSDTARDISIPHGSRIEQNQVEARFNEQGVHVLRETDAVGGPHWHLDF